VAAKPSTKTDSEARRDGSRATLRLGFDCNNACLFCGQAGLEGPVESDREVLAKLREDHDEITFIGGEPSLDDRLPKAIESARELGFGAVGLQTNARRLAEDAELFAALVDAGLSDLQLSIHAPTAEAHDYHTDRPGSLAACTELITRAQRANLTVVVASVITRSNFRELPKMPPALKRRGVAAWLLEVVRPYGRAADNFARVVPRFGMALPWTLHALEQARRHALSAWIRGAPLCALGPFAASALPAAPRSYPEPCRACPSRARCPGVDPAYVEVFGVGELKPGPARPPAEFDAGRSRLMRMFVGVGELVERPPQLDSPVPADEADGAAGKNRRLPILANDPPQEAQSSSPSSRDFE
jgi:hypothetical protein